VLVVWLVMILVLDVVGKEFGAIVGVANALSMTMFRFLLVR